MRRSGLKTSSDRRESTRSGIELPVTSETGQSGRHPDPVPAASARRRAPGKDRPDPSENRTFEHSSSSAIRFFRGVVPATRRLADVRVKCLRTLHFLSRGCSQ